MFNHQKRLCFFVLAVLVAVLFLVFRQIADISRVVKHTAYDAVLFEREIPQPRLKFLFLGDSTAVGTGAKSPAQSTAGYFGQDFPDAAIVNISRNGKRIHELLTELRNQNFESYDLVVIQIGANDIMKFTSMKNIENDLTEILRRATQFGRHVVILHSGNVGIAPIFQWPFDVILAERSKRVRAIYIRQAKKFGAVYVDLFSERKTDLFLTDIKRYYAGDFLHPSGDGYRYWYERIRESLKQAGVVLE